MRSFLGKKPENRIVWTDSDAWLQEKHAIPCSRVEKNAAVIADTLRGQTNHDIPAVVAEFPEALGVVQSLLGSSAGSALEALEVLERVLEQ